MDAAAFVGSGVLAERLADFIQENLDDAAAIASLTDSDLSNVNGQPLNDSELVRVGAQHAQGGGRARSSLAGAAEGFARTRAFCAPALRPGRLRAARRLGTHLAHTGNAPPGRRGPQLLKLAAPSDADAPALRCRNAFACDSCCTR